MALVKCRALSDFTVFTPGIGQTHGDPNNSEEAVRFPNVPDVHIESLRERGKIEVLAYAEAPFSYAKAAGVGMYEITGPGGFTEMVKGKKKVEDRVDELNAEAMATPAADDESAGPEKAPAD